MNVAWLLLAAALALSAIAAAGVTGVAAFALVRSIWNPTVPRDKAAVLLLAALTVTLLFAGGVAGLGAAGGAW